MSTTIRTGLKLARIRFCGRHYGYDGAGNLVQFTDRKGQVTTHEYNPHNRQKKTTFQGGSTINYSHDAGGRLTSIVDSIAGTITRDYDSFDQLKSEITPQGRVDYTYDGIGRRDTMTVLGQPTVNYGYDTADRLTQIVQGASTVQFGYDSLNRRTSLTLPNGVVAQYGYDGASQMTSIQYKKDSTTLGDLTYGYDVMGNRIQVGGSFARTGIPQAISTSSYNAANHQLGLGDKAMIFDNNGNLTRITDSAGVTDYTWNARNQLVGISGPGVNASFVYDGVGRREKKTINSNVTEFLYDGLNPVQETSGSTILANILPGFGIDEFLTRTDVIAGTTSAFLTDVLGSPIAVTDNSGVVQTEYTYEPFGRTTVSGMSNTNSFQYTGRENDFTSLYYYRARYYHSEQQRFISEDPIEFRGGDINIYVYVNNNPINLIDPTGLVVCKGRWVQVASSPRILFTCYCYWECVGCDGGRPLYRNPYALPRTVGTWRGANDIQGGAGGRCGYCAMPGPEESCPC